MSIWWRLSLLIIATCDLGMGMSINNHSNHSQSSLSLILNKDTSFNDSNIQAWQRQCYHNADQFINLCQHFKVAPNIWDLYEWWNWLTPNIAGHKRFDTIFYTCFVNECPTLCSDGKEISSLRVS